VLNYAMTVFPSSAACSALPTLLYAVSRTKVFAVLACLFFAVSCDSVNSVYDTVVGAGEKPVPPPTFTASPGPSREKIKVSKITVTAPPKGTVLVEGSTRYGIRNYTATYSLEDNASDAFLELANKMFEFDDFSTTRVAVDAGIAFKVHTSSRFLCKATWETTVTVTMRVSIDEPAKPLATEMHTASVEESLCAAAGVQLFPSSTAMAEVMQRAFDEVAAKALAVH
jgi:hypothetical protein